jgi:hypothetical protein
MTEEEWLASADPEPMLRFARRFADDAALRTFACACCFRVWGLVVDERARSAVEVAESFARGLASRSDLDDARDMAEEARGDASDSEYEAEAEADFCYTARYCEVNALLYAVCAARQATTVSAADMDDDDYFGNHGSHYWAEAAQRNDAMSSVFTRFGESQSGPVFDMAMAAGEIAAEEERKAQAEILRGLVRYTGGDT